MKKAKTLIETEADGMHVANILTEQESDQESDQEYDQEYDQDGLGPDGPQESGAAGVPEPKPFDPRLLPEFRGQSAREYHDNTLELPLIEALGGAFLADYDNARLLPTSLGRRGLQFTDRAHLRRWLAYNSEQEGLRIDRKAHAYTWTREPDAPTYTLDQKRVHVVYETGGYIFLKLPHDPDFIRREGVDMSHPVTGDTRIITYDGTFPIKDLVGQKPRLLTRKAGTAGFAAGFWQPSEIHGYSPQPIFAVKLRRKGKIRIIRTTATHRWYAYRKARTNHNNKLWEMRTDELQPGYSIPCVEHKPILFSTKSPKGVRLSPVGVAAGVTFGDGSRTKGERYAHAVLYGKKDASLAHWFSKAHHAVPFPRSVGGTVLHDLPRFFKELPPLNECAAYLLGWLAGYIAADGCVSSTGCVSLASAIRANLECVSTICQRFGIGVSNISKRTRTGYGKKSNIFALAFKAGFPIELLLLDNHKARWKSAKCKAEDWAVLSVQPTGETEPVYCAVVPKTGVFALEDNILTGNCLSTAHRDYCERMIAGQIEVYSQTEIATGRPVIDIEVALTKPSYNKPVTRPTVTQIRGPRNQLPPDDRHLPALMDFLTNYGGPKGWQVTGHHVVNFDGRADGDVVMARWKHLQNKGSA